MDKIINELVKIDLVKQNSLRNYNILPKVFKKSMSIEEIEEIINNLQKISKYLQMASNPRTQEYPIIKSSDPMNVCFYIFVLLNSKSLKYFFLAF